MMRSFCNKYLQLSYFAPTLSHTQVIHTFSFLGKILFRNLEDLKFQNSEIPEFSGKSQRLTVQQTERMAWTDTLNDMQYPILRWSDVDVPLWLNLRDMIREFISSVCSKNSHAMQPRDTCQNTMSQWHYVVTRLWFFEHPVYPFRAFETSYRLYPSWWFRRFHSLSSSACLESPEDYTGFRWKKPRTRTELQLEPSELQDFKFTQSDYQNSREFDYNSSDFDLTFNDGYSGRKVWVIPSRSSKEARRSDIRESSRLLQAVESAPGTCSKKSFHLISTKLSSENKYIWIWGVGFGGFWICTNGW